MDSGLTGLRKAFIKDAGAQGLEDVGCQGVVARAWARAEEPRFARGVPFAANEAKGESAPSDRSVGPPNQGEGRRGGRRLGDLLIAGWAVGGLAGLSHRYCPGAQVPGTPGPAGQGGRAQCRASCMIL